MSDVEFQYEYWREYPERDPQAVVWYPCIYTTLDPDEIWDGPEVKGKEIGFYIHVPLCKKVCKYCPFNKYNWTKQRAQWYLDAVKKEIRMVTSKPYFRKTKVITGYLGGGTPTSLATDQLIDLISCYQHYFNIAPDAEMSIEANPDTVDRDKLKTLHDVGINRISFGVQSFQPQFLKTIGRNHKAQHSIDAIKMAKKIGFDVITIDLLYRIPGQTLADWEKDLKTAIELELDHITTFSLFLDPGTKLFDEIGSHKASPQPNEEIELAMYQMAIDILEDAGYRLYTLYDFAKPGKECLHHAINWKAPQEEYPGIGPGAFSFIQNGKNAYIYCNISPLKEYIDAIDNGRLPVDFGKKLSREEEMSRYMVLGVNFLKVQKKPFREQFGVRLEEIYGDTLRKLEEWRLITVNDEEITLTEKGRIYLANVSKSFFTKENKGKPHIIGVELQKKEGLSLVGLDDATSKDASTREMIRRKKTL